MNAPTILDEALRHAAEGFDVFPLVPFKGDGSSKSDGKRPAVKWKAEASKDPAQLRKWFGPGGRHERGGLALRTGAARTNPDTGAAEWLVAVDVDMESHGGKNGLAALKVACADEGLNLEDFTTRVQQTAGGGWHALYWSPVELKDGTDVFGEGSGVDMKADSYIVVAPTKIGGKQYAWKNQDAPIAIMGALASLFPTGVPRTRSSNREPLKGVDSARAEKRVIDYLATAERSVKGAGGDQAAYRVAAKCLALGATREQTLDAMLSPSWDEGCGWAADRLQEKIEHAWKYMTSPPGADAPEAAFEPVAEVDPITEAHTWDRDRITANACKLYNLRLRDRQRFDGLRQAWAMFDAIADDELQDILGNAALLSAGISAASVLLADPGQLQRIDVQRAMASLSRKDSESFAWLETRLVGGGIGKRAINAACKAGRDAIAERAVNTVRRKDGRTLVTYNPSNVAQTVDNLEAALLADSVHARVFKHSGAYVSVWEAAPVTVRELAGGGDYPPMAVLHRYDAHSMAERLNRSVRLEMPPPEDGAPKAIAPPEAAVRMLLSRRGGGAPVITGIIEAPTVRDDGTLLDAEGYDAQTGLFAVFGGRQFAVPPDAPTQADAATSLRFLQDEVFAEFPFAEPVDRTAAVAALITGLVRPVLAGSAPGFLLASPTQGTGKTALAQAICHGAFGRPAPAQSWPGSDEEMSKYLLGALREGQRAVVFDNLRDGTLVDNAELAAAMTSDTYSRRGLGGHDTVTVPTAVLWLITGNNVRPAGDMPSRLVEVYLDANVARPDQRHFARDLVSWVASRRPQIVAAAIAIVRAYLVAGCPRIDAKATRFDKWDRMVRLPLIYAGGADVGTKFDKAYANDPGLEAWAAVLVQWRAAFGDESMTTSDLLDRLNRPEFDGPINALNTALRDAVSDGRNRELSSKSLGGRLAQFVNRPLGALCLRDGQNRKNVKEWRVCQALSNPT
jgi:Bifunctional DNA primase/polymerase, N-terminal.